MSLNIEDYALIGDCETAALIGRDGSVDWLCWPRFDSDACFAGLLGTPEHGRWLVAPQQEAGVTRRYLGDTLILETRFETKEGAVRLVDFMPPRDSHSNMVRLVIGEAGRVAMRMELIVRLGYGALVPWVHRQDGWTLRAIGGADQVVLRTPLPVQLEDQKIVGSFTIAEDEVMPFTLTYAPSHLPPPEPIDPPTALTEAERFWLEWSARARVEDGERRGARSPREPAPMSFGSTVSSRSAALS
jgi:GH15 family glucan-1,4-alpha-glucosidase